MITRIKYIGFTGLIFIALIALNGCHVMKKSVVGGKTVSEDENMVRKVIATQPEWRFMEIRMSGKAIDDEEKFGFIGTVRLDKGKQIFIILRSTIGIEVARLYANRDSVWIQSKVLGMKEKGDWKFMTAKIGYPLDFNVMQGILTQTLFSSKGDLLSELMENLVVKNEENALLLTSDNNKDGLKYLIDFSVDPARYIIQDFKIRDIRGQWLAGVKYQYNKENQIKKIDVKGLDSESNFSVEMNIVKMEIKDNIEINFTKF